MTDKIHLEIVTPEKLVVKEEVEGLVVPGVIGEFTVLPGHTTLLSELGPGRLHFTKGGKTRTLEIQGGFAEVAGDRVKILADTVSE